MLVKQCSLPTDDDSYTIETFGKQLQESSVTYEEPASQPCQPATNKPKLICNQAVLQQQGPDSFSERRIVEQTTSGGSYDTPTNANTYGRSH